MRFITLTPRGGAFPVHLNAAHIVTISPVYAPGGRQDGTTVTLTRGEPIHVNESAVDVFSEVMK